jgi:hypothetical protein
MHGAKTQISVFELLRSSKQIWRKYCVYFVGASAILRGFRKSVAKIQVWLKSDKSKG